MVKKPHQNEHCAKRDENVIITSKRRRDVDLT